MTHHLEATKGSCTVRADVYQRADEPDGVFTARVERERTILGHRVDQLSATAAGRPAMTPYYQYR